VGRGRGGGAAESRSPRACCPCTLSCQRLQATGGWGVTSQPHSLPASLPPRYGPRPNVREAVAAYCDIAARHGMSPAELALRWVAAARAAPAAAVRRASRARPPALLAGRAALNMAPRPHASSPLPPPRHARLAPSTRAASCSAGRSWRPL
jgi:hypothetical protein